MTHDNVTQKEFAERFRIFEQEAKKDRHEFNNKIHEMFWQLYSKLDKVVDNHTDIKIIWKDVTYIKTDIKNIKTEIEKDIQDLRDENKELKWKQDWMDKKIYAATTVVWVLSWVGGFAAQFIIK